jgi:glycosyltransferase involved in cell wall biosynthesis
MRKKVLILNHSDGPQFIDVCNQYVRTFDPAKYEVTAAYLVGKPTEESKQRNLAEHLIYFNFPKKIIRGLKIQAILTLLKLCRENQFEFVICHRYKAAYIMMWVAKCLKIPALFFVMHEFGTMSGLGRRLLVRAMYQKNMMLAGVSNAIRDDLRKALPMIPENHIITLYNMADVSLTESQLLSKEQARALLKLPEDAFIFGNLARLTNNKDHVTLISAFAKIKPFCPKAKLIILGDGELEASLRTQVSALALDEEVIFAGFVSKAFIYMRAFDAFVLSSIQEAFGRVLLEAMIAKVPVIASKVHGIPEVLGDTNILVNPKEVTGFADALKKLYQMSAAERQTMGEQGYQRVQARFSLEKFREDFWSLPLCQECNA